MTCVAKQRCCHLMPPQHVQHAAEELGKYFRGDRHILDKRDCPGRPFESVERGDHFASQLPVEFHLFLIHCLSRTQRQSQFRMHSGDASRDVANALQRALELEPGETLFLSELPEAGERLQDLLGDAPLHIEVQEGFDFWIDPAEERTPELEEALTEAREQTVPMVKVDGVQSAYWTRMGKEFLRWIRPEDEYTLLNALARLQVAKETELEDGVRMIGAFRACGLLVPV